MIIITYNVKTHCRAVSFDASSSLKRLRTRDRTGCKLTPRWQQLWLMINCELCSKPMHSNIYIYIYDVFGNTFTIIATCIDTYIKSTCWLIIMSCTYHHCSSVRWRTICILLILQLRCVCVSIYSRCIYVFVIAERCWCGVSTESLCPGSALGSGQPSRCAITWGRTWITSTLHSSVLIG